MSVVEDVRQVLQDFIAPELRAVNARLDAMEAKITATKDSVLGRLDSAEARLDSRIDALKSQFEAVHSRFETVDQRFETITATMNARFDSLGKDVAQLKDMLEIDRRLTKLESRQSPAA